MRMGWGLTTICWLLVAALCSIIAQPQDVYETTFLFSAALCPYNCSNQGTCDITTQTCSCFGGYGGDACQYAYQPLAKGSIFSGNLTNETLWEYFAYTPNSEDNFMQVLLHTTSNGTSSVAHLYAKYVGAGSLEKSWPRTDFYDYRNSVNGLFENITIYAPKIGLWVIGIYNVHSVSFEFNITATSLALCPNNCSNGNGICNSGKCSCNQNYTLLPDCSQYAIRMQNNISYSMILQPGQWAFYALAMVNQNAINVTLNETTPGTESILLRLYAASGTYPTAYSYSYAASIATQSLQILNVSSNYYYFGVYFPATPSWTSPASYNLIGNAYLLCPNSCSGQGTCQTNPLGVCQCNPNRKRPDCSEVDVPMDSGTTYTDQITAKDWAYYELSITNQNTINVAATELESNGSLALYGKKGAKPNIYSYDLMAMPNISGQYSLQVINPPKNSSYYLGVYALAPLKYSIKANPSLSCPNGCSGHGMCVNGTCNCSTNWTALSDCSQFNIIMSNGQNYSHNINAGVIHYYQLYVVSANQLVFDVNITSPSAPLSILVQYGAFPTLYSYQAFSNSTDQFHRIEIDGLATTQEGTWFVAVVNVGNTTTSYTIQGFALRICPNECSGNGQCQGGICNCKPTYTNYDCSSEEIEIASSVEVSGVVHAAQWNFYHIDVLSTNALHIKVTELNTVGKVWLYMLKGDGGETFPSQNRHTFANKSDTAVHEIFVPSVNSTGTWFIGCFGSPYLGFNEPQAEYSIIALVGCNDYTRCDNCVQDPNCGWCADNALDPSHGFCTSGTAEKPFNNKCVAWLFSECNVKTIQTRSALLGVVIGICVGGGIGLLLMALALIIYKRRNYYLKKNSYSPFDVTIISDDEDNAEEYIGGSSRKESMVENNKESGGGWKEGLSSLFHNMSSSFGKLPELDHGVSESDLGGGKKTSSHSTQRGDAKGYNGIADHDNWINSSEDEDDNISSAVISPRGDADSPPSYGVYRGVRRRLDDEGFFSDRNLEQEKKRQSVKGKEKETPDDDQSHSKKEDATQAERKGSEEETFQSGPLPEARPRRATETALQDPVGGEENDSADNQRKTFHSASWLGGHTPATKLPGNDLQGAKKTARSSWFSWNFVAQNKPAPQPVISSAYESIGDAGYHSE